MDKRVSINIYKSGQNDLSEYEERANEGRGEGIGREEEEVKEE